MPVLLVAHFFCIGGETRNEGKKRGEKRAFIGEFENFGTSDRKRGPVCTGATVYG